MQSDIIQRRTKWSTKTRRYESILVSVDANSGIPPVGMIQGGTVKAGESQAIPKRK